MKLFASAAFTAALALVNGQCYAHQFRAEPQCSIQDAIVLPAAQQKSSFDFNHRGAGSDKSDELGVPYYNNASSL